MPLALEYYLGVIEADDGDDDYDDEDEMGGGDDDDGAAGGKKKKGGKKGKKGKEEPEPDDEYMKMAGADLEKNRATLKEKLVDAKLTRNMLQMEKDMIHDFYHNTR